MLRSCWRCSRLRRQRQRPLRSWGQPASLLGSHLEIGLYPFDRLAHPALAQRVLVSRPVAAAHHSELAAQVIGQPLCDLSAKRLVFLTVLPKIPSDHCLGDFDGAGDLGSIRLKQTADEQR